jgi:hypothetical protein
MFTRRRTCGFLPTVAAIFFVATFVFTAWGLSRVIAPETDIEVSILTRQNAGAYRAAAVWGASFLVFVIASIWTAILALTIVRRYLATGLRLVILVVAGLLSVVGLLMNQWYVKETSDAPLRMIFAAGIPIYQMTAIGNSIAVGVVVLSIAASCSLMRRPRRLSAQSLRNRIEYSRLSLFSAAIFLIAGVAEIYFLNDWPAHVYVGATSGLDRNSLHELAVTMGIIVGVMYSTVLLAVYVPLMAVQEQWVRVAAERAVNGTTDGDPQKWREMQMLSRTVFATFAQILAVVGPSLAALGIPKLLVGMGA